MTERGQSRRPDRVAQKGDLGSLIQASWAFPLAFVMGLSACGSAFKSRESRGSKDLSGEVIADAAASRSLAAELSATEATNGSIVLVTVNVPEELRGRKLSAAFEGLEVPFYPLASRGEGVHQAVLGVPFGQKPGASKVVVTAGEGEEAKRLELPIAVKEGDYPFSTLKVAPKFTNPNPAELRRILREQAEVGRIYRVVTPVKYWEGPFVLPADAQVSGVFGTKRMFNGEMKSFHQGLDLAIGTGVPIHAPAAGKVVLAKDLFFTGNTVLLDHGFGVFTIYAHMSRIQVRLGQEVKTRDVLGLAGATGRVTGPHLHWGAVVHRQKVNPADLTKVMQ